MAVEWRTIVDRRQWLEEWRPPNINGTDIPVVLGRSRYKTPLRLWAEKRGVEFPREENAAMRRGRWLEPGVAEAVGELRPHWQLRRANVYLVDADQRLGATPDYFIEGDPRGQGFLQCKTATRSVYERDWDGGDSCAPFAAFQNFAEISLGGVGFGAVAVLLVDGYDCDCKVFEILPHETAWRRIEAAVAAFWRDVDAGVEPSPDYRVDSETLSAIYPRSAEGKVLDLSGNDEVRKWLEYRAQVKHEIGAQQEECTEIEARIKHLLGDAEKAIGIPGFSVTYRSGPRAGYTVEPKENVRPLIIKDRRANSGAKT